ncbi:MAG: Npt1/Npt2 family nucleotide transporter [Parachlamydiales bacterium]|jgi:AAA family ATP:ADP antiporter
MFSRFKVFFQSRFSAFSLQERRFIFSVGLSIFLVSFEYGITRPVCTSLFVGFYGAKAIASAWYVTVPINLTVVYFYNRFLPKWGCFKLFLVIASSAVLMNSLAAFFGAASFLQFIWKDIYILLMFKQLWSLIHSTIATAKAKYLYGIIAGMGGFGSVLGGLVPLFLAVPLGTQRLLFFSLPIYVLIVFLYYQAYQNSRFDGSREAFTTDLNAKGSFFDFRSSKFVWFILFLVFFMQISTALLELQFNFFLAEKYPLLDYRTRFSGYFMTVSQMAATFFQFFGAYLAMRFLDLKKSHLLVPLLLALNSLVFLALPSFAMAAYLFASIKTIDFSLFGVVREMLYIPLKVDEKFRAKAVIDVFVYRTSKAFAPLLLLAFEFFFRGYAFYQIISLLSLFLAFFWILTIIYMFKYYEKMVPAAE